MEKSKRVRAVPSGPGEGGEGVGLSEVTNEQRNKTKRKRPTRCLERAEETRRIQVCSILLAFFFAFSSFPFPFNTISDAEGFTTTKDAGK